MTCEAYWPSPLWIEAFDPYPWHGLVYQQADNRWLQPSEGRPAVPLPPSPLSFQEFPNYLADPALWDIGNPDPPYSQCLYDAGGESLGRGLLRVTDTETRVGGVTRKLDVRWSAEYGRTGELRLVEDGVVVASTPYDQQDVTAGVNILTSPYGGDFNTMPGPLDFGVTRQIDRSADGTRRLITHSNSYTSPAGRQYFIVGVVLVTIGQAEDGSLTLTYAVAATTSECLGAHTYSRNSDRYSARINASSGSLELTPIPPDYSTGAGIYVHPHTGTMFEETERKGRVMGGWLTPGGVALVRCDHTQRITQSGDPSGTYAEKWSPSSTSYENQHWRVAYAREREYEIRLYSDTDELTLSGRDDRSRVAAVDSNPVSGGSPTYLGSVEYADSELVEGLVDHSVESTDDSGLSFQELAILSITATAPPDMTKTYAPEPLSLPTGVRASVSATCQKAWTIGARTATDLYMSAVITPEGSEAAPKVVALPHVPFVVFNPLTLEVTRSVDHLDKTLLGVI